MGFQETLRLLVEADTKGAVQNVEKLGTAAQREASKSKTNLDKWGNGLTKAGAGMVTFGAVALAGLGAAAMASEEARLSEVKLENTLANMPKLAGENKKQFIDLADAIQGKTAADGDAIVAGEAMLGTFSLTADEIKNLTPLVVDYARKFGLDIPAAATMVGKAVDGSVGALKRNGVSIDEVMFKTDRYGAVQKALSEQVGGFAEAEGKTFAGSLQRMKNQMGDVVEGVGVGAVDAFTDLAGGVTFVTDKLNAMSPAAQSVIGKTATFGAVALIATGGVTTLAGQLIKSKEGVMTLINAGSSLVGALGGIKGAAIGAAGAAGIGALIFAAKELEANNQKKVLDEMAEGFEAVNFAATDSSKAAIRNIDSIGLLDEAFQKAEDSGGDASKQLIDLAEKAGVSKDTIADYRKEIDQHAEATKNAGASQDGFADSTDGATDAMGEAEDATKQAEDALKDYLDTLRGTFDPLFAMSDALSKNQEAHGTLITKQMEAKAAQDAYDEAVRNHGETSKAATEAAAKNMDAQQALTSAERDARGAVVDLKGASATLKNEMDNNGLTAAKARQQFINMALSMGYTQGEAEQLASDFGFVTAQAQTLGRQRPRPSVNVTGDDTARRKLRSVRDEVFNIPTSRHVDVTVAARTIGNALSLLSQATHHAGGGPMAPGEVSVVGEDGPELVVAGAQGAHVYNQAQLKSTGGGRSMGLGGETHIHNYYIAGSVLAEQELLKLVNKNTRKGRGLN